MRRHPFLIRIFRKYIKPLIIHIQGYEPIVTFYRRVIGGIFLFKKYIDPLLAKCVETAKRCHALLFVNALYEVDGQYRNTTYAYNRQGELVGKYFKKHLSPPEQEVLELDLDYTFEFSEPYILEIDGLRYGFMTCCDFYFYEAFANMAKQNVDIIIGCSLQRSDSHDAIETMCRFLAYNTNAYVLRSSVSFSEDSDICGASMAVSPYGKVLCNMKGKFGMETVEFNPKDKYYKPAGYLNPIDAADETNRCFTILSYRNLSRLVSEALRESCAYRRLA